MTILDGPPFAGGVGHGLTYLQKHKSTANSMFVLLKSKNYTFIVY